MDVILSLPIISYFGAPLMTSWSTSLNLLFFYLTWSTLVLSHGALRIEVAGTLAVRLALWLAPSLAFLAFDTLLPSVAAGLKLYGRASLPPSPRREPAVLARRVALALFNLVLLAAAQAALSAALAALPPALARAAGHRRPGSPQPPFRASTTLPLPWQIVRHLLSLYAAREVLSYAVHRYLLHGSGPLARLHARYAHARRGGAPYALVTYADHPLPLLVARLVPGYLPAAVAVRPHLLTWFLFTALTTVEETLSTSGYAAVPGILMAGIARRTARHHASGGRGNYGPSGLLDWICGTSLGSDDIVDDVRDEAEKHRLTERGEDAVRDAGDFVKDGLDGLKKTRKGRRKV